MTNPRKYQLRDRCKVCHGEIIHEAHTTHQIFCSAVCRDTWWREQRSRRLTRSDVSEKITKTKVPAFEWSDAQAAWMAAMIDGEGTIGIWREKRTGNLSGKRYKPVIVIANTSLPLLDAIRAMVNGWGCLHQLPLKKHHKPCYRFTWAQRTVLPTLERIAPFLVIKKQQADITMEFCRLLASAPVRSSGMHDIYEGLYQEMKELNRRGLLE